MNHNSNLLSQGRHIFLTTLYSESYHTAVMQLTHWTSEGHTIFKYVLHNRRASKSHTICVSQHGISHTWLVASASCGCLYLMPYTDLSAFIFTRTQMLDQCCKTDKPTLMTFHLSGERPPFRGVHFY